MGSEPGARMKEGTIVLSPGGFSIEERGAMVATFNWGSPGWTVYLRDTRVPSAPWVDGARPVLGSPRIKSFDPSDLSRDRDLLTFPVDPSADPVLATNTSLPGILSAIWGPLRFHQAQVSDAGGKLLIVEAFNRGFEVRRLYENTSVRGSGTRNLVTRIRPVLASLTPEVNQDNFPF